MKLFPNLSIKAKLIVLVVAISMISIIVGFSIVMVKDYLQIRRDLLNKVQFEAALVGEYLVGPLNFDSKKSVADVLEKMRAMPDIEHSFVYNETDELYGAYHKGQLSILPPTKPPSPCSRFGKGHIEVVLKIIADGYNYGTIYVRASTAVMNTTIRNRILWLGLIMISIILIASFLAFHFQRLISQPILTLAKVTEKISSDIDYSIRVNRYENDEIGILYKGFNSMLDKIQLWERKRDEAEAEQKRLMLELEAKNKELEQVVYVASHDLRSPLVNIQGFGQELSYSIKEADSLLQEMPTDSEETKQEISNILRADILESLKFIQSSTAKMDGLLSGLLRLSRVGRMSSSTFETIDMNLLFSEVANAFEYLLKEGNVSLTIEKVPSCLGCELEINQVFSNLVSNAIKYRDNQKIPKIRIFGYVHENGNQVVYGVEDNGIGIPREYQSKIFQIFHRLRPDETEGEGLGLAIVLKIVQRHNGKIDVESTVGQGSRFLITLPRAIG